MVLEPNPAFGGGSEAVILDLAQELAKRGHDLFLLHEHAGSMLPVYETFIKERLQVPLPGFPRRRPLRAVECIASIGRLSYARGVDVIISSHLGFIDVAVCASAIFGTPWCFHLGLPSMASRSRTHFAWRMIGAGVAPSAHTAETWRRAGWPVQRLHVIPNGVNSDRFAPLADRPQLRRDLNLCAGASYVVFIGRICREKGIQTLIEAFRQLAAEIAHAHLLIVGSVDDSFRGTFEETLAALPPDVRRKIIVRPVTDSPERFFAAADVACVPSIWDEPFGLTLLEAMSCALPVIASRIGIFADIMGVDNVGMLLAPGDAAGLADKLRWWLSHPGAGQELGKQFRQRVLGNFTWDASVDRYEALLATLTGSPSRISRWLRHS
jgi:glycosyltransferase involved in cell wall biosynthesis